jgi:hypothetical protein
MERVTALAHAEALGQGTAVAGHLVEPAPVRRAVLFAAEEVRAPTSLLAHGALAPRPLAPRRFFAATRALRDGTTTEEFSEETCHD